MDHKSRFDCKKCGDSWEAIGSHLTNPEYCPDCDTKIALRDQVVNAAIEYNRSLNRMRDLDMRLANMDEQGVVAMVVSDRRSNFFTLVQKLDSEVK